jgi:hypothetical protein
LPREAAANQAAQNPRTAAVFMRASTDHTGEGEPVNTIIVAIDSLNKQRGIPNRELIP